MDVATTPSRMKCFAKRNRDWIHSVIVKAVSSLGSNILFVNMFMPEKTAFCYTLLEKYGLVERHNGLLEVTELDITTISLSFA